MQRMPLVADLLKLIKQLETYFHLTSFSRRLVGKMRTSHSCTSRKSFLINDQRFSFVDSKGVSRLLQSYSPSNTLNVSFPLSGNYSVVVAVQNSLLVESSAKVNIVVTQQRIENVSQVINTLSETVRYKQHVFLTTKQCNFFWKY